jgi:anti-anti-sigma regulatory factor
MVGDRFACVKIRGRATFTSSIDFKTVLTELRLKGYNYFVLDLADCTLMDSTFLGVLTGFGLKMRPQDGGNAAIELLNPNERVVELLDSLGVIDLFKLTSGLRELPQGCELTQPEPGMHSRLENTAACIEAHKILMSLSPENAARFKDVAQFLAEDLKRLKAAGSEQPGT